MNLFTHIRHSGRNEEKWNFIIIFPTSLSFSRIIFRYSFHPFHYPQTSKHKKRVELHSCKYLAKQMSTVTRKQQRKRMKKFTTRKNSNNFHFFDFFSHSVVCWWKEKGRRSKLMKQYQVREMTTSRKSHWRWWTSSSFTEQKFPLHEQKLEDFLQTFSYLQTRCRICRWLSYILKTQWEEKHIKI